MNRKASEQPPHAKSRGTGAPGRGPRAGQPQLVGDLVSRVLQRAGLSAKVEAATVLSEWPSLVGPQIAAVTQPQKVSDGTLFVAVSTSAWMMELSLMKEELLRRLNAGKREGRIRQIVFVMGEGRQPSASTP